MTFNEIKTYLENYARQHVDILHTEEAKAFIALNNDKNADEFIRTCKKPVIMVLLTYDKKLFPPKGENYNWDKSICFFILKKAATDTAAAAQNDCEIIVNDFCSVMINDRTTAIRGLVQESIAMMPVGPMSDDFYGQACMFSLVDEFEYQVDPARWQQH